MLSPAIETLPAVGVSNPEIILSKVVLPQPDGPSSEKNSPCCICSETPFRALTEPKSLVTSLTSIIDCFSKEFIRIYFPHFGSICVTHCLYTLPTDDENIRLTPTKSGIMSPSEIQEP